MNEISTKTRHLRMRWVVAVACSVQALLVVLVLGSLSYQAGVSSAERASSDMRRQIFSDMRARILASLGQSERATRLLASPSQSASLRFETFDAMQQTLFDVLQVYPTTGYTAYGARDGQMITVGRNPEGAYFLDQALEDHEFNSWSMDHEGRRLAFLENSGSDYLAYNRPWYQSAAAQPDFSWSDVYVYFGRDELAVDGVLALRDDAGEVIGVVDVGFLLRQIDEILQEAREEFPATVVLVDDAGQLIASAEGDAVARQDSGEVERQRASRSSDPVVRAAALWLEGIAPRRLTDRRMSEIPVGDDLYHVLAAPLGEGAPGDWRLLIAIPDPVFSSHIASLKYAMFYAIALAMSTAFLLALMIARTFERPVMAFVERAQQIREGRLEIDFPSAPVTELETLSRAMAEMVTGLRERDRMRDAFARYVSPRLIEQILSEPDALRPGGRLARAVVLFTDLRGFTNLTERLGPRGTTELLNQYFSSMFEIIERHDGFVVDMVGDAILIVFGLHEDLDDEPIAAVRCAIEMQNAMQSLDLGEGVELEMGAGMHVGDVIVGNIGSEQHIKYGVVGDPVNTAARIESLTVGGELLVSQAFIDACGGLLQAGAPREVPVKGKDQPLRIFSVEGVGGDEPLDLITANPASFLPVDRGAVAYRLVGKSIDGDGSAVQITGVAERHLQIRSAQAWQRYDVLRIDVERDGVHRQFYGQIRTLDEADGEVVLALRWVGAQAPDALGL